MKFITSNINKNILVALLAMAFILSLVSPLGTALAQFNPEINYQGKLTNGSGTAVADGTYNMNFWLVPSSGGATSTAVWSEARTGANRVQVTNGLFSVMLGDVSSLSGVDFDQTLYLAVEVGGTGTPAWDGELLPRKILGAVPAAFVAQTAATADNATALGGVSSSSFLRSDEADTMTASSSSSLLTLVQNGIGKIASFFSGATEVFTILANGSVGVGTSTPSSTFAVDGNSTIDGNMNVTGGVSITGSLQGSLLTPNRVLYVTTGGYVVDSDNLTFNGTNLGVGTTSPTTRLSVSGDSTFIGNATTTGNAYFGGYLGVGTNPNTSYSLSLASNQMFTNDNMHVYFSNVNTYIGESSNSNKLELRGGGNTGAHTVYIDSVGAMGLGESAPATKLEVVGTSTSGYLAISSNSSVVGDILSVGLTGRVGIGTSTPGSKLTVAGDFFATGAFHDSTSASGTAGMVLQTTGSGTQWVATSSLGISGSGSDGVASSSVAFSVHKNGVDQAISNSSSTLLTWSTELYDTNNNFASNRFQPTVAGKYVVHLAVDCFAVNYCTARIAKNGTTVGYGEVVPSTGSNLTAQATTIIDMDGVSDYLEGYVIGSPAFNVYGVSGRTYFTGALIAPSNGLAGGWSNDATQSYLADYLDMVAIGTSTAQAKLDVWGTGSADALMISSSTGSRLFTVKASGNVGIGTSTPSSKLTVAGDIFATGAFRDSSNASGTLGMILQTTGTTTRWVATSTLGYVTTFLALTDTPSSFTANRIMYTNSGATALIDNADFTYDGTDLGLGNGDGLAFGGSRMFTASSASQTIYIGTSAGANSTSTYNNFIGGYAGESNYGTDNNFIGWWAGRYNKGSYNFFVGNGAGSSNTGSHNNIIGYEAGYHLSGTSNTIMGNEAFQGSSIGSPFTANNNVAIGYQAGYNATTSASNNILLGYRVADNLTSGANNLVIGYDVDIASTTGSNQLNIGNLIFGTGIDGTGTTLSSGNIGIGTSTPGSKLSIAGDLRLTGAFRDSSNASGTLGMVLQSTGTSTKWLATSTLGLGNGTFLGLSDTPSSFTANRIMYTNSGATALVDSADFTYDGTNLGLGADDGIAFGGVRFIYASTTNDSLVFGENAGATFTDLTTNNISLGFEAGRYASSSVSDNNNYIGYQAGYNSTGARTNFIGYQAGYNNNANSAIGIGFQALGTTTNSNTDAGIIGIGYQALFNNTSGSGNTAVGFSSMVANTTGGANSALGFNTLQFNTTGSGNTAVGYYALQDNIGGSSNSAFGNQALTNNIIGNGNSAFGNSALGNSNGYSNSALGNSALGGNTDGDNNTAVGNLAGRYLTDGTSAASTTDNSVYLGYNTKALTSNDQNTIVIGYDANGIGSNSVVLGNDSITTTVLKGNVGLGTTTPASKLSIAGDLRLTGAFRDSSNASGTLGMLLQSTGSGTQWVATSTLGLGGGGSLFTDAGAVTYLTATGDNLAIGTTTAGSRLTVDGDLRLYGAINFGTTERIIYRDEAGNTMFGRYALTHNTNDNVYGNTAFGDGAGGPLVSGFSNTFMGFDAGTNIATGSRSVVIGNQAAGSGAVSADIGSLVIIGDGAGYDLESGANWGTFVGYRAGENVTTGSGNQLFGYQAGNNITSGYENLIIGYDVDAPSATGFHQLNIGNMIFGTGMDGTGTTLSTGNIGIGTSTPGSKLSIAGDLRLTGAFRDSSNASGTLGMVLQSTGTSTRWVATSTLGISGSGASTFLALTDTPSSYTANRIIFTNSGATALTDSADFTYDGTNLGLGSDDGVAFGGTRFFTASTTGNMAMGQNAGLETSGNTNIIAIGNEAARNGSYNSNVIAIGYQAGRDAAGGASSNSIFLGYQAGATSTGQNNFIVGQAAGTYQDGDYNILLGRLSGVNSIGSYNTLLGDSTGGNQTGSYNNVIGSGAGIVNTGNLNSLIGHEAGRYVRATSSTIIGAESYRGTTGFTATNITTLGYRAGYAATDGANNNILIGYQAADNLTSGANNLVIGYDVDIASTTGSNQLNIGNLIFGTGIDGTGTTLSTGNIGIGTSTPGSKLSIAGDLRLTGAFRDSSNASGTLGMVLQSTGTSTRWVATSTLGISGGGSLFTDAGATTYLTATGDNLAIGTTTATFSSKLTIEGDLSVVRGGINFGGNRMISYDGSNVVFGQYALTYAYENPNAYANVGIGDEAGSALAYGWSNVFMGYAAGLNVATGSRSVIIGNQAAGSGAVAADIGSMVIIGDGAGYDLDNGANWGTFVGYRAGENVNTGSGNQLFGYQAGNNITSGYENLIIGYDIDAPSATGFHQLNIGNMIFGTGMDGTGTTVSTGNISIGTTTASAKLTVRGSGSNILSLYSSTGTTTMLVESDGDVGFGSTPNTQFTIFGKGQTTSALTNSGNKGGMLSIVDDNTTAGSGGAIVFGSSQSKTAGSLGAASIKSLLVDGSSNSVGHLAFSTRNGTSDTSMTERMRILYDGNVAIGTTTAAQKLQVWGNIRVGTSGTNGCLERFDGTALTGTCSSDEDLKTNINALASEDRSYLEGIASLNPVTYQWNEVAEDLYKRNTETTAIGLIAQEVEVIFPELVSIDDKGYRQVDLASLPFYIIQAIKEIWTKLTDQQEKIDELEQRIQYLESLQSGGGSGGGGGSNPPPAPPVEEGGGDGSGGELPTEEIPPSEETPPPVEETTPSADDTSGSTEDLPEDSPSEPEAGGETETGGGEVAGTGE